MGHRQTNTCRQKRKTKLHSVPRRKADDYEGPFKEQNEARLSLPAWPEILDIAPA